jgi:hypothetical protein
MATKKIMNKSDYYRILNRFMDDTDRINNIKGHIKYLREEINIISKYLTRLNQLFRNRKYNFINSTIIKRPKRGYKNG